MKTRIFAVLTILVILFSIPACQKDPVPENTVEETPRVLTHVYAETPVEMPDGYSYNKILRYTEDSVTLSCMKYVTEGEGENRTSYQLQAEYTVYKDGRESTLTELEGSNYEYSARAGEVLYGAGSVFDDTAMTLSWYLEQTTADGRVNRIENVNSLIGETDRMLHMTGLLTDGDGYVYLIMNDTLLILTPQMSTYTVLTEFQYIQSAQSASDGMIYLNYHDADHGMVMAPVLREERRMGDILAVPEDAGAQGIFLGTGYDLYYWNNTGFYGYNTGEAEGELLMHLQNSSVTTNVQEAAILDPEHIFLRYNTDTAMVTAMMSKAEDIDLSQIQVLELAAAYYTDDLTSAIVEYNKQHQDMRVVMLDYSQNGGTDTMLRDLDAGMIHPDLFYISAGDVLDYLLDRELYTDLYPLMEGEEKYNTDNLFGAVKNTYTRDGKLFGMPTAMAPATVLVNKTAAGEREGWTVDEMLEIARALPEGIYPFDGLCRDNALDWLLGDDPMDLFVDWEAGTADFTGETFKNLLSYIMTLPEEGTTYRTNDNRYAAYHEGKAIAVENVYRMPDTAMLQEIVYFGEDNYLRLGYPTSDGGNGSYINVISHFVIAADSDIPEIAWDFIKTNMPDEDPELAYRIHSFPVWKSTFDVLTADMMSMNYFIDFTGGMSGTSGELKLDPDGTYRGEMGVAASMTEEMTTEIKAWLDTIGKPYTSDTSGSEILEIVSEEISALTAGTCTVDQCAERIQSRAGIWLAEHQ